MNKNTILAHDEKLGNIQQCICGMVHIHCFNISLRFNEEAFLNFALMTKEASDQLINRNFFQLLESEKDR